MSHTLLQGKIALITGAAKGIGRVSAEVFGEHGAKLVLADVDVDGGEATAQSIRKAGGEAIFLRTDVASSSDVQALVAKAIEHYGRLDCALNNAGIDGQMSLTGDCTEENFDHVVAVNLRGVFLCMKYALRPMLAQGSGAIVNVSSVAGLKGFMALSPYVAAKHGVVGLTRAAALEYAPRGIRINALCPGVIRTPMLDDAVAQGLMTEEQLIAMEPIGRMGESREIAEAAAWMCSDKASFMLGHALVVDGGIMAG
jgi:NAD(P)-dependent dehydrogenase (short-subunit alcohol dehydrogenase family)